MNQASRFEPRRRARRRALQALYQWRLAGHEPPSIIREFLEEQDFANVDQAFFESLVLGVAAQWADIESRIEPVVDRPVSQLDVLEHIVVAIGVFELINDPGTPARVVIDECVDLSKRFGAEQAYLFVNGVLDRLSRALRAHEFDGEGN